ncbi:flagellar hook-basal body protein [Lachnobacterium bovis]|uniref:flagellar hook-basal body protein n=1 Tax=Lachnobacterium bovis TaxID=140626 RepID=UPI0003B32FC4|nr:flagellar hook-basal body protein [Lachnobacterium bovis]
MVKGLYTAHMGMVNEMRRLDVLANNLANAQTTGYKKEGTTSRTFADEMAIKLKDTSAYGLPTKIGEITFGVHLGQVYTDYGQGSFIVTNNASDFALDGNGFFAVSFTDKQGNTSVKYTRDGSFVVNTEGYLMTKDGDYVMNQAGAATGDASPENYVRIDPNTTYAVNTLGQIYQNGQIVGNIGVTDFDNYDYLEKYGENLYNLVEGGNHIQTTAKVRQSTLEASNVNVVSEMVNMITIQRAYEAGQKVIVTEDSTLEKACNEVGKVQ